ncbi:hypothetical protein [Cupriavidus sp. CP313]
MAVATTRKVDPNILRMLRASPLMGYPKNDEIADLIRHKVMPVTFGAIVEAWQHVH